MYCFLVLLSIRFPLPAASKTARVRSLLGGGQGPAGYCLGKIGGDAGGNGRGKRGVDSPSGQAVSGTECHLPSLSGDMRDGVHGDR